MARPSTARTSSILWPFDGQIRRYGANGRLEAKAGTQGGKKPFSIALHPGAAKLAVGFSDTTAVEVYDARTLKRLYAADTSGISGGTLGNVAWSGDGARLYAGGHPLSGTAPVAIWQDEGRGKRWEAALSQSTIMQLLPCGDSNAVGTQDPAFGLFAVDGAKRVWQEGVTTDMRNKLREAFTLSADGRRIRFGLGRGGKQPILFDLAAFRLAGAADNQTGLAPPKTTGIAVTAWEAEYKPKLNGKPLGLEEYETSRSLAIAPDASRFLLGTEYGLRAYSAGGK
jgi:hypothetical protein